MNAQLACSCSIAPHQYCLVLRSSTDLFATIYPPGRFCHQKTIMRPLQTGFVAAHGLYSTWHDKHEPIPREVLSAGIYVKHLQCVRADGGWDTDAPLCQRAPGPVDYTQEDRAGVEVCPGDS